MKSSGRNISLSSLDDIFSSEETRQGGQEQIRQIPGVKGVITTLYYKQPGELWTREEIHALKEEVEAAGLKIEGIESVNVSDAIKTGSAEKIADTIVTKLGEKRAVAAIAIATMIICAVGVFIDISVITVAPIALAIGEKAGLGKGGVLLAMIGGGKAGNIISPNPNTIAVSEAFNQDLTAVMIRNAVPAVFALAMAIFLASRLVKKPDTITTADLEESSGKKLPGFLQAVCGPLLVIIMLALRPIAGIAIDPLIALPVGGIICTLVCGKARNLVEYMEYGLTKVVGVSILLIGTGTIA